MADALDGEERPPEGHATKVRDCYRAPTYSSETYPRFPQELIDRICEFLRLDPFTLTRCRLVCHAWYCAARRVYWDSSLKLQTREDLDDCAYMLMLKNNRSYGKIFHTLQIQDDPRKPLAHIWPMRIPGYFVPRLEELSLINFNWTATRPHDLFFHFLSYYTSIKTLIIERCQFRSIAELRRISTALPSLENLSLAGIALQHQLVPGLVSHYVPNFSRNKLKRMNIGSAYRIISHGAPARGNHIPSVYHQFLWDVCVTYYSYVTELELDLRYCSSLSSLHRFLHHFPHLSHLLLHDAELGSDVEPASAADLALYTAHEPNPSLSDLRLEHMPASLALQFLLVLSSQTCSRLEALRVFFPCWHCQPHDRQRAEFVLRVTEVLCLAGARLKTFEWEHTPEVDEHSIHDDVPRLTANTSLTGLKITLNRVDPSPASIQRALDTLLSDIRSPHLERLMINIYLTLPCYDTSEDRDETLVSEADPPGSTSTFHAILSRSVFDQLPAVSGDWWSKSGAGVLIVIGWFGSLEESESQMEARTTALSAIKSNMITLFAPWLDRGVVQLEFNSDPDGEEDLTRNSSSVLRVLGTRTHASIKEIPDSENNDHARDAIGDTEAEEESSLA
ncbi:uncharacterized protein B0H18DRAFT_1032839 [Fomitopsis serialis]|uniref:uncharacterized protein n=1 Tax=Fomitopsis serialis TaxID=139415 RepID=UPI002007E405|nr:uncharacterized protein B0H18DRAFT_1032839 [Neoantrodia serialis]KAH9918010.1 hypothetical protein B0H18DRAFT_1032839 [Neoantrodia serialis]